MLPHEVERKGEIRVNRCLRAVDGERVFEQRSTLFRAPSLQSERAEQLQGIEVAGTLREDLAVNLLGVGEGAMLLERNGLPKQVIELTRVARFAHVLVY